MAKQTPITAEVPEASPSSPSVMFAPLETAVMMKMTIRIYSSQVYFLADAAGDLFQIHKTENR